MSICYDVEWHLTKQENEGTILCQISPKFNELQTESDLNKECWIYVHCS